MLTYLLLPELAVFAVAVILKSNGRGVWSFSWFLTASCLLCAGCGGVRGGTGGGSGAAFTLLIGVVTDWSFAGGGRGSVGGGGGGGGGSVRGGALHLLWCAECFLSFSQVFYPVCFYLWA